MAHRTDFRARDAVETPSGLALDSAELDAVYGLEPVFDPATHRTESPVGEFVAARCPYCAEPLDVDVDLTFGARSYVEDCAVCCHPIEMTIRFLPSGKFEGITLGRLDG